jgi:hypothetical protein
MKQDKFLIGILVGILVLIAAAVGLFYARQGTQGYVVDDSPEGVVHNYVYAVQQEDFERAYGYLGEGINKPTASEFQSMLNSNRYGYTSEAVEILGYAVIENADGSQDAVVDLVVIFANQGPFADTYRTYDSARLELQGGEWKLVYMPYAYWGWDWYDLGPDVNSAIKPVMNVSVR